MTIEELKNLTQKHNEQTHKPRKDLEHQLQVACVKWFSAQYPHLRNALFAVPNGGRRDAATGRKLKDEGVLPGVADLLLAISRGPYNMLCVEMKTTTGRQSESQKQWQQFIQQYGPAKYIICRTIDDFINEIKSYLSAQ